MASGSDLPRLIGEHLYAPSGITHWRQLGEQLEIPFEAYKDRCYGYGKSRVEKVLNVLAEDSDATLWDVVEALRRMGRIDAIEMIAQDFPDVMGEFKICIKCLNVGLINDDMYVKLRIGYIKKIMQLISLYKGN